MCEATSAEWGGARVAGRVRRKIGIRLVTERKEVPKIIDVVRSGQSNPHLWDVSLGDVDRRRWVFDVAEFVETLDMGVPRIDVGIQAVRRRAFQQVIIEISHRAAEHAGGHQGGGMPADEWRRHKTVDDEELLPNRALIVIALIREQH